MSDIKVREEKIKEKRKQTPFREYLKEIASWKGLIFYRNTGFVSRYPETKRSPKLIASKEYQETRDGFTKFGLSYEAGSSFFESFLKLFQSVHTEPTTQIGAGENTLFSDSCRQSKNVYLSSFVVVDCENVFYSIAVREKCTNIFNTIMAFEGCSNVYQCAGVINSYNVFYSKFIKNCSDVWFSENLLGCKSCIGCSNLENKSYYIDNESYNKEEYEILFSRYKKKYLKDAPIFKISDSNIGSNNVTGVFCTSSEDVTNGFLSYNQKDGKNIFFGGGAGGNQDMYDVFFGGAIKADNYYAVQGMGNSQNIYCSTIGIGCSNIYYSMGMESCSYCLGCIGLKNKSFCILNKEYSKEERYELANKIFEKMNQDGTLGEFFPGIMNPFYFNDTAAYLIDDTFTKEEVEKEGYMRRDDEIKVDIPANAEIIGTNELNNYQGFDENGSRQINPDILKKVIRDEKGNYYRIVKMEYDFLMKHGLPLPELHRLERIKLGFKFK